MRFLLPSVCCALAFPVSAVHAAVFTYVLPDDEAAMTAAGWYNTMAVTDKGLNFNGQGAGLWSPEFDQPITNIVFYGHRTENCTRMVLFEAGDFSETWDSAMLAGTSSRDFYTKVFGIFDNVTAFSLICTGGAQNFYLQRITVYAADPAPAIGEIEDQRVGTNNTLAVQFAVDLHGVREDVAVSATAENLGSPETPIPANSYWIVNDIYGQQSCIFYFSPATAGIASGRIRFTITATGQGGCTSRSFVCTVVEGTVKSPPLITFVPMEQGVLANRTFTGTIVVTEADGDEVTITVSATCNGTYSYDEDTGFFSFTPALSDVAISPITFTVRAADQEGTAAKTFRIHVEAPSTPTIAAIADQSVAYGSTAFFPVSIEKTDDDEITDSNVTVKAGTEAPAGEAIYSPANGHFEFSPDEADLGKTFVFEATATDIDGTATNEFSATVILAAPVLKRCGIEAWTGSSFMADIEAAVPGATSYNLRHIRQTDGGTPVTNIFSVASFPHVVSGLASTNYVYDVQAVRGAVVSDWSNAKSIDLHAYIAPTYAIPMTGTACGSYRQDFNGLVSSGSAYWYDARTIPGWYAASSSGSMSDVKYAANTGGSSGTGILSCQVDDENVENRALAARADTQYDEFSFGVLFTNMCKYAVTNLHVSFAAMQFRRCNPISRLYFSYTRSDRMIDYSDSEITWTPVDALEFAAPTQGSSARLYPPVTASRAADIPFVGENAIQPGEVIALRWFLDAKRNYPTLGIDDLEVSWRCRWPHQTVISVR